MSLGERAVKVTGSEGHGSWYLCSSAEQRLRRSMANGSVMLVDGIFLVKFTGKMSGLALRDATASNGYRIKAGHWYSPVDEPARQALKSGFDQRKVRMHTPEGTEWAHMRVADNRRFNLFLARLVAIDLRLHLTGRGRRKIHGDRRSVYRAYSYEWN